MREWLFGISSVWLSLGWVPAPHLKTLKLIADSGPRTIHHIPFSLFQGTPPPQLNRLVVQGFSFEEPCPAFRNVTHVWVDLAVLHSTDQPPTLGDLFPGAQIIAVARMGSYKVPSGALDERGNPVMVQQDHISKVPTVTAASRLRRLHLMWSRGPVERDRAAGEWLRASAPFCGTISVAGFNHADVHAALFSWLGQRANDLFVRPNDTATSSVGVCDGVSQAAFAVVFNTQIARYVALIAPLIRAAVNLYCTPDRLEALAGIASPKYQGRIQTIFLEVAPEHLRPDGGFVSHEVLAGLPQLEFIFAVKIDARTRLSIDATAILTFVDHIAPKLARLNIDANLITVTDQQSLLNRFPYALQTLIALAEMSRCSVAVYSCPATDSPPTVGGRPTTLHVLSRDELTASPLLAPLAEITNAAFVRTHAPHIFPYECLRFARPGLRAEELDASAITYVLTQDETIIGAVSEEAASGEPGARAIRFLAVNIQAQRQGIAVWLMGLAEHNAARREPGRRVRMVLDTVKEVNEGFYARRGYRTYREEPVPPGPTCHGCTVVYMDKIVDLAEVENRDG
ncbi:hypothetical protein AURDEDRAFT_154485 [Auricularia subglabra TFB-10046 SS5]|uniref:N-acetyltransferase domain-containing protein n=1 Tax=Auricularia subglabra (strain TFB-10046 / SS5) TaxID=717982 RepID=J0CZ86_AURST|nr:hypothetical protein AURDEDRAFT_154485 [Auricularia subglabra TFB-10046 SS5]